MRRRSRARGGVFWAVLLAGCGATRVASTPRAGGESPGSTGGALARLAQRPAWLFPFDQCPADVFPGVERPLDTTPCLGLVSIEPSRPCAARTTPGLARCGARACFTVSEYRRTRTRASGVAEGLPALRRRPRVRGGPQAPRRDQRNVDLIGPPGRIPDDGVTSQCLPAVVAFSA